MSPTAGTSEVQEILVEELREMRREMGSQVGALHDKIGAQGVTISKDITDLRIDVARLEVKLRLKSGVWGALAGLIPTLGGLLFLALR